VSPDHPEAQPGAWPILPPERDRDQRQSDEAERSLLGDRRAHAPTPARSTTELGGDRQPRGLLMGTLVGALMASGSAEIVQALIAAAAPETP
jgi:hypothetical protein